MLITILIATMYVIYTGFKSIPKEPTIKYRSKINYLNNELNKELNLRKSFTRKHNTTLEDNLDRVLRESNDRFCK